MGIVKENRQLRVVIGQGHGIAIVIAFRTDTLEEPAVRRFYAVLRDEVEGLFGPRCDIDCVDSILTSELPPKFQQGGVGEASESIYVITKRY